MPSAVMIILRGSLAPQHLASSANMTTFRGSLESQNDTSSCCEWRAGLQIWRVPKNILNKEWWTANKGWSSSLGARKCNNTSMLRISKLWNITHITHATDQSSCLYRASVTIKTLYYRTDAQIYNLWIQLKLPYFSIDNARAIYTKKV